jgi:hypothetical protein
MDIAGSLVGIVVYRAVLDVFCHFSCGQRQNRLFGFRALMFIRAFLFDPAKDLTNFLIYCSILLYLELESSLTKKQKFC